MLDATSRSIMVLEQYINEILLTTATRGALWPHTSSSMAKNLVDMDWEKFEEEQEPIRKKEGRDPSKKKQKKSNHRPQRKWEDYPQEDF